MRTLILAGLFSVSIAISTTAPIVNEELVPMQINSGPTVTFNQEAAGLLGH